MQSINDIRLLRDVRKDPQVQEDNVSSDSRNDEAPEERWCRYTLMQDTVRIVVGITQVPLGMDMDDAFPPFHSAYYEKHDKDALAEAIMDGGLLMAESNFEPRSLLAYRLDDPHYWYGREETLKYLGVTGFRRAC